MASLYRYNKDKEELLKNNNAIENYREAIKDTLMSREKYIEGDGVKKRKGNGYKLAKSKYNNKLYINMDKLLSEMVIEAAIDDNIIYMNKADRDTIDILTKWHNPKKKYTKLSIKIFNDLNKLSVMVKKMYW